MKKIVLSLLIFSSSYIFSQQLPKGWSLISLRGKPAYINLKTGKITRDKPEVKVEDIAIESLIEEEDDNDIFDPTIFHKVSKGETLKSVAKKYDLRLEDLVQLNSSSTIKEFTIGTLIIIGYAHNIEEKRAFLNGDISILKHEHDH